MSLVPLSLHVYASKCIFPNCKKPQGLEIIFDKSKNYIRIYRVSSNSKILLDENSVENIWRRWLPLIWKIKPCILGTSQIIDGDTFPTISWTIQNMSEKGQIMIETPNFAPPISIIPEEFESAIIKSGIKSMGDKLMNTIFIEHHLNFEPNIVVKHNHRIHTLASGVEEIDL